MGAIVVDMVNTYLPFVKHNPIPVVAIAPFIFVNAKTLPTKEYAVTIDTKYAPELLDDVALKRLRF